MSLNLSPQGVSRRSVVLGLAVASALVSQGYAAGGDSFTLKPSLIAAVPQIVEESDRPNVSGGGPEAIKTWVAPNSGNFSTGSNWTDGIPPVAGDSLVFGASGTQSYTANNDQGLTFASSQISNTGTGTITRSGGLNAGYQQIDRGNVTIAGGTFNLTSLDSTGVNTNATITTLSTSVGNISGASSNVTFNGATVNGRNGFFGNADNATTVTTFNGGTYNYLPTSNTVTDGGRFGTNLGTSTINIQGGATVNTTLFEVGRNANAVSTINISGTGTTVNANQWLFGRDNAGAGTATVSGGAIVNINFRTEDGSAAPTGTLNVAGSFILASGNATGNQTLNVNSGGKVLQRGNTFIGGATLNGAGVPSTTFLNVSGAGSEFRTISTANVVTAAGGTPGPFGGQMSVADGRPVAGATSTITVSNGGLIEANRLFTAIDILDQATINISGTGSTFIVREFATLSGGGGTNVSGGITNVTVSAGGNFTAGDVFIGNNSSTNNPSSRATVTVTGTGSTLVLTNDAGELSDANIFIGASGNTRGTLNVQAGATVTGAQGFTLIGATTGAIGALNVDGAGSSLTATGVLSVGGGFVDANQADVAGGSGTVAISNGGVVTYDDAQFGTSDGASGSGTLTVSGTGSALNLTNTSATTGDLLLATGTGTATTVTISNNGRVNVGGNVVAGGGASLNFSVASGGVFQVGGGQSTTGGTITGSALTFNINSGGTLAGNGNISAPTGSTIAVASGGIVAPGNNGGIGDISTVGAGMNLAAGSQLQIQLASTTSFDSVTLGGSATIAGQLVLSALSGFTATPSATFTIVTGTSRTGTFSNSTANTFGYIPLATGAQAGFLVQYNATTVVLTDYARKGDVNRDGNVDNLDIAAFVTVLTSQTGTNGQLFTADADGNGVINNLDIAPFVQLLLAGGVPETDPGFAALSTVPEPASIAVLGLGAGTLLRRRRRA